MFYPATTMQNICQLAPLLSHSAAQTLTFHQLIEFALFASRLTNDIILAQSASYSPLTNDSIPILPPTIHGFLSSALSISPEVITMLWESLARTIMTSSLEILFSESRNLGIYQHHGHSLGISGYFRTLTRQ